MRASSGWVKRGRIALLGVCVALVLLPFLETYREIVNSDWTNFAAGARIVAGQHPQQLYDRSAEQQAQDSITGGQGGFQMKGQGRLLPFVAPPWVALLAVPFNALGFAWGGRLFILVELAALAAGVALAVPRQRWAVVTVMASFPAAALTLNAQVDGLVVLSLGMAIAAWRRGHQLLTGLALGLSLLKPHLVLPIGMALLLTRHWRVLIGWALAAAGLVGATVLRDPSLLWRWYQADRAAFGRNGPEIDPASWAWSLPMPVQAATLVLVGISIVVLVSVLALAARVAGTADDEPAGRSSSSQDWALGVLIAGGVLAAPHALGSDLLLVALAMALIGRAGFVEWALFSVATYLCVIAPEPWPPAIAMAVIGAVVARPAVSAGRRRLQPRAVPRSVHR